MTRLTEIRVVDEDWLAVRAPYDALFVSLLKEIPVRDRRWTGTEWRVRRTHVEQVKRAIDIAFEEGTGWLRS